MNIAIVDTSLYLLAFARMPGAKLTSIDLAINKAFTAAGHRLGTHAYREKATVSGAPLTGVHVSNGGRFVTIAGGLPVVLPGGVVVGAVGVSAGAPEEDRRVAQAGVDAVLALVREAGGLEDVGRVKARL